MQERDCAVTDLAVGMILHEDLHNANGLLIVGKGLELTFHWIERLKELSRYGIIRERVTVSMPRNSLR